MMRILGRHNRNEFYHDWVLLDTTVVRGKRTGRFFTLRCNNTECKAQVRISLDAIEKFTNIWQPPMSGLTWDREHGRWDYR